MSDRPTLVECDLDEYLLDHPDALPDCTVSDCRHPHDPAAGPCLVVFVDDSGIEMPCGCPGPCPTCKGSGFTTRREFDDGEMVKVHDDCTACEMTGMRKA